jgi:hypothetical protein
MKIIKVASDIKEILSLPKEEFQKNKDFVKKWILQNYPAFVVSIKTTQHGGEAMLDHVVNFLLSLETDGYSTQEIYNMRVAIIHHDIDRIEKRSDEKRSHQALNIWESNLAPDLESLHLNKDEVGFLVKNHDALGYFWKTFQSGLQRGLSGEEIWKKWISKHPDINSPKLLDAILAMNVADNMSGGGLNNEVKRQRVNNCNVLHSYLLSIMEKNNKKDLKN